MVGNDILELSMDGNGKMVFPIPGPVKIYFSRSRFFPFRSRFPVQA